MAAEDCPTCCLSIRVSNFPAGSILVCGGCLSVLIVGGDRALHLTTQHQLDDLPVDLREAIRCEQQRILTLHTEGSPRS